MGTNCALSKDVDGVITKNRQGDQVDTEHHHQSARRIHDESVAGLTCGKADGANEREPDDQKDEGHVGHVRSHQWHWDGYTRAR